MILSGSVCSIIIPKSHTNIFHFSPGLSGAFVDEHIVARPAVEFIAPQSALGQNVGRGGIGVQEVDALAAPEPLPGLAAASVAGATFTFGRPLSAQPGRAAAATAGGPPPSWVDKPMRWAQLTLVENDPGRFDPQFWLDYFARTRSDAVCLSAGGCIAYYPTEVPFHHRSAWLGERDVFGELVTGCRKLGMVVTASSLLRWERSPSTAPRSARASSRSASMPRSPAVTSPAIRRAAGDRRNA
jgi:hypothetical protein